MRKRLMALAATALMSVPIGLDLVHSKAEAALTVYDPAAVEQMIQNVTYMNQQLQLSLQNLATMDSSAASANMGQIQQQLAQLQQLQSQIKGLTMDYANMEQSWDETYKDFGDFNGMSGKDYANHAQKIAEATNNSIYDAMVAQGLVAQLGNDEANLQSLAAASQNAQGALAAAQAGNQIAALQAQQLMRLQQIMAQSERAKSAYEAERAQKEAMSRESNKQAWGESENTTPMQDGGGAGLPEM